MRAGLLLCSALLVAAVPAATQQSSQAHMEACTVWNYGGDQVGTRNDCDRPVAILFMAFSDQRIVEAEVPAGGWFDSGISAGVADGFIFTACPVGFMPSLRFSMENRVQIAESMYNCVPGRPNS